MADPSNGERHFEVKVSEVIAQNLRQLQRQAAQEGRGKSVLAALRQIAEKLRRDPENCGEPLYRLPALRMGIRTVAVRPLVVDFAVCEDRDLVFLKAVKMLAGEGD